MLATSCRHHGRIDTPRLDKSRAYNALKNPASSPTSLPPSFAPHLSLFKFLKLQTGWACPIHIFPHFSLGTRARLIDNLLHRQLFSTGHACPNTYDGVPGKYSVPDTVRIPQNHQQETIKIRDFFERARVLGVSECTNYRIFSNDAITVPVYRKVTNCRGCKLPHFFQWARVPGRL